jgi:hypothetical protein
MWKLEGCLEGDVFLWDNHYCNIDNAWALVRKFLKVCIHEGVNLNNVNDDVKMGKHVG